MPTGTIVINDDNPGLREVLVFQLEAAGFRVLTAATGAETLQLAATRPVDLVLTDAPVPDGDALEMVVRLRERLPDLPIVVLTAKTTVADELEALDHGANDYITKPWDRELLVARLRNLIEWRRLVRGRIESPPATQ